MPTNHRDDTIDPRTPSPALLLKDPLDRIAAEHGLQLELCDALELIADELPGRIDATLLREVINVLAHGMTPHFAFEEHALFPLLRRRASDDHPLMAALTQLETEHERDADLSQELVEQLRHLMLREEAMNPDMLGYMLRGYFESQRRHVEWENSIVLPAARRVLTAQDRLELAAILK